jgi:hypothetical protein
VSLVVADIDDVFAQVSKSQRSLVTGDSILQDIALMKCEYGLITVSAVFVYLVA